MSPYLLIRSLLFRLDAERSHTLVLRLLKLLHRLSLLRLLPAAPAGRPLELMGVHFPNALGLAAGLDKNGDYIDALGALGFGFIEIGTVTPRPQPGNARPRLFRLPAAGAIINRMGFNNKGVDHLVKQVQRRRYRGVLGINIGKNFDTPIERAAEDYLICLRKVYAHADYITVNISSPNTANLRQLQQGEELAQLMRELAAEREQLKRQYQRYVPIAIKIAPDLEGEQVEAIATAVRTSGMDAVIATNTTISRESVQGLPHAEEAGGLSGQPVRDMSTEIIRQLKAQLDEIPIIGVGGIFNAGDAREKLDAGASLVQIYTGFIYRGPALVREILNRLS
ncbi:MAG: quinone-dependent dihydroorotate dehydrogenase [Gammaproteobacteria bacterium]|nr:quinone-dependent dihydroorotate dehydrogenase [Gammaproteobacteria bacterium]